MTRPTKSPLFSTDPMWAVEFMDPTDKSVLLLNWISDSAKVMILSSRKSAETYIAWRAEKAGTDVARYRAVEYFPTGGDHAVDVSHYAPKENAPF